MSTSTSTRKRLFSRYIQDLPSGELTWIGLRPERKAEMVKVIQSGTITLGDTVFAPPAVGFVLAFVV